MEKGLQNNLTKTSLLKSSVSEVILREQPDKGLATAEICALLLRLVKLYQIPNFDETSAVLLAEWVCEHYQYDSFKAVAKCLQNPPQVKDEYGAPVKNWRLTPDTIQAWMAIELEKEAEHRERVNQLYKQKDEVFQKPEDLKPETEQMIREFLDNLKSSVKPVAPITEKEIIAEGGRHPKVKDYTPPTEGEVMQWAKKVKEYQRKAIKERNPSWTDAEIEQRLREINS